MTGRTILLNPGPVTLTPRVRAALHRGDWCHREPEFAELTRRVNAGLAAVYGGEGYRSVILTGSGTAAVEAMLASFAPDDGGTLVIANGVYGERMGRMLAAHRKPARVLDSGWLGELDLDAIEAALEGDDRLSHVAVVHHETTTGRLNRLDGLGELCRRRGLTLLLDAVSSFGAERIDLADWNVGALAATANKCLHGVPGLSFVLASEATWSAEPFRAGSVYLDLRAYHDTQHGSGFSPFTQSVQSAFALDEALAEFADDGGWQGRRARYRARARAVHSSLSELGVETLLPPDDYSSVLWSYRLPAGTPYATLHDALKADGFVIYAGQGDLSREIFRVAHMGDIGADDLERLKASFRRALSGP